MNEDLWSHGETLSLDVENLVDESTSTEPLEIGETQSREVKTLPSHLMNFQWSREQKWHGVRVSTVYVRTFRRTQIAISP